MNILEQMTNTSDLTPLENEIVQYMLKNSDEIIQLSISQLAGLTYTSNAVIIRLCRKLGTSGFKDFKIKFAQELSEHRQNKAFLDVNFPFSEQQSSQNTLNKLAKLTQATVEVCHHHANAAIMEQAADLILNSQNVYIYASGDSLIRSMSLQNKLLQIGIHLTNTALVGEGISYSQLSGPKDCAFFISYSSHDPTYLRNAEVLQARQTPIFTMTAFPESALAKHSDYVIAIPHLQDSVDSIATFYAQVAFEYMLNGLYALIFQKSHIQK